MFISRKKLDKILSRLDTLERQNKTHAAYLHKDFERLNGHDKVTEKLFEETGISKSVHSIMERFYSQDIFTLYGYSQRTQEAKPFSLTGKVNAILDHLGLKEEVTATTKLVKKAPEKKKKVPARDAYGLGKISPLRGNDNVVVTRRA